MSVHVFGVRHHGPGSARSLRAALERLQPDAILVEGPPDADAMIEYIPREGMEPPVALLLYAPEDLKYAVYYPFAVFSPEWQAMHYGVTCGTTVRFMDLPHSLQFAAYKAEQAAHENGAPTAEGDSHKPDAPTAPVGVLAPEGEQREIDRATQIRMDPLGFLARTAGYEDGERWWEHLVEHRRENVEDVFDAVYEAMLALRDEAGEVEEGTEALREAHMRKTIRAAQKEGFERIAVVCGAWHAPALVEGTAHYMPSKHDNALLKGLPKGKIEATWIPWTHSRLSRASGYGAGINSPGWYHHLWTTEDGIIVRWLALVAELLREQDMDASTAQVIDSVRLVEALAAIRGRPLPGLEEMNEAVRATMCFGADEPMRLIEQKLVIGESLGHVPDDTPMVPLMRDLRAEAKRLKGGKRRDTGGYFDFHADVTPLNLDLRETRHLERSHLLHRLRVLDVPWGDPNQNSNKRKHGTFHEDWMLQWKPEYAVSLIEASIHGNTVVEAATNFVVDKANTAEDLPTLTDLLDKVMLANLGDATERLMKRVQDMAAVAGDIKHLMAALPALVNIMRYGSVREMDTTTVGDVLDGLVARICVGLPNACASLDDEAAMEMYQLIIRVNGALNTLNDEDYLRQWTVSLERIATREGAHGLVRGRAVRLLSDAGVLDVPEVARRMRLAISTAANPVDAAAWVEGFLRDSGLILLYEDSLWSVVDEWILSLTEQAFKALLPLLRRTFATFDKGERRSLGERAREGIISVVEEDDDQYDYTRGEQVYDIVSQLLGLS